MKKIFAFTVLASLFFNTNQLLNHKEVKTEHQESIAIKHAKRGKIYQKTTIDNSINW